MGLRFRKSFGSGPFRATVSKSGVGWSVGTKGARVAKKSGGGFRTSVGSSGVSYVKDSGGRKKKGGSGCLASILAVLLFFCCLGACGGETETTTPEPEENVSNPDTPEESEPEPEPDVIELNPVFVDPFGGNKNDAQPEPEPEPEQDPEIEPEPAPEQTESDIPVEPVVPENPPADPQPPVVSDPLADNPALPETERVDIPSGQGQIVYITETGEKYHRETCRYLEDSKIQITLDALDPSYTPCGVCKP